MSKVVPRPEAGAAKAPAAKKAPAAAKKAPAKKAPPAKKASGSTVDRKPSTISKEGTKVDAFDGKEYPVTQFPTVRQKDGSYVRGEVTRANLPAWRAARKAEREKAKAAAEKAKASKKAAAPKAKAAAKTEDGGTDTAAPEGDA